MNARRVAPHKILVDIPPREAQEACWRAMAGFGLSGVVIDLEKNLVAGFNSATPLANGEEFRANFEPTESGTIVTLSGKTLIGRPINIRIKRRLKRLTDEVEKVLAKAPETFGGTAVELRTMAPIASPSGESSYVLGSPIYGTFLPPKRGGMVLAYAVFGLICCQISSMGAWGYANRTLKDYGDFDPGDKTTVKVARILAIVGTLLFVTFWAWIFWGVN